MVYEDTFLINSDIAGGLPEPAGRPPQRLAGLGPVQRHRQGRGARRWTARPTACRTAPTPARSGSTRTSSPRPGCPPTGSRRTGTTCSTAARAVKAKVPGVIPLNIYAGKGLGEAASMQGFEMLLYGTGAHPLRQPGPEVGGRQQGLHRRAVVPADRLQREARPDPAAGARPELEQHRLAAAAARRASSRSASTARWVSHNWLPADAAPWAQWNTVMGTASMPTQNGQDPGKVSMSGGWTWAIPKNVGQPGQGVGVHQDGLGQGTPPEVGRSRTCRSPCARTSPPTRPTWPPTPPTSSSPSLVPITNYRPAYAVYPGSPTRSRWPPSR